jgi:hypothetical protein
MSTRRSYVLGFWDLEISTSSTATSMVGELASELTFVTVFDRLLLRVLDGCM